MSKTRVRKTDPKTRELIFIMYDTGAWSMTQIADLFQISVPRVCQIVKEYRQ